MIIIGIDPSLTSTGICAMRDGIVLSNEAVTSKFTGAKRLSDFKEQLIPKVCYVADIEDINEKVVVFIEGYSFGSVGRKEFIAELGGTIRLMLYEQEIEFVDVPPTVLKKYITGKGVADKVVMAVAVQKQYGVSFPTTDQTDAFCLAILGMAYLGLVPNLTVFRQEIIDGMKKPKVKKKKPLSWKSNAEKGNAYGAYRV